MTLVTLTPADALLAAARALSFAQEHPFGSNAGEAIFAMLRSCGLEPEKLKPEERAWCAAYVTLCGVSAFGDRWPLKRTASVRQLYEDAYAKNLTRDSPRVGDVFVLWYPSLHRYAHTGIVTSAPPGGGFTTLEGNTSDPTNTDPAKQREGWRVAPRSRTVDARTKFLRWSEAL